MRKQYLIMAVLSCLVAFVGSVQAEENSAPVVIKKEKSQENNLPENFECFQIKLDGEVYSFPGETKQWEEQGWEIIEEDAILLAPERVKSSCIFQKGDKQITAFVQNKTQDRKSIEKSTVIGISMDFLEDGTKQVYAELPGKIFLGRSTMEKIIQKYGMPAEQYEGETYWILIYRYGMQSYLKLEVNKDTEILTGFEIENAVKREEKMETATAADAFLEQKELSGDIFSGQISFDSCVYELPASVSEFLNHGFEIVVEESDAELSSLESGVVVLQKDNKAVQVRVQNFEEETMPAEQCLVTSLSQSWYETGFSLVLPGEIQIGMTKEELEKALQGIEIETAESDEFFYYGIADREDEWNEIAIFVEKETEMVVKIEIEKE